MIIIKIGGGDAINLSGIARDAARLQEPYMIIHGANALRDSLALRLNIRKRTVTSVSGYSSVYSNDSAIDLQMMTYSGLRNKRIVEMLQQNGVNAVGLSGVDGGVIRARRNRGIRVRENGKLKLLRDLSGKPHILDRKILDLLLDNGYTPVLTVPILDEHAVAVNSENDDIVVLLQKEYRAEQVIHLLEAPGFLREADDPSSLISSLTAIQLAQWEAIVQGRIKRKLLAIKHLLENRVQRVIVADGRVEHPVLNALAGKGTVIK